jgi:nitrate reductase NapE component
MDQQSSNEMRSSDIARKESTKEKYIALVMVLIVAIFFLLGIALVVGFGYLFMSKKNITEEHVSSAQRFYGDEQVIMEEEQGEQQESTVDVYDAEQTRENMYYSEEFGFSVPMQPGWENYEIDEVMLGGDFHIADINFYLPSQYASQGSTVDGYAQLFTISVYVTDSWDDPQRDHAFDEMLGEVVGKNDYYTLLYSHFNGDIPDISSDTIRNMERIVEGIETFPIVSQPYDDSQLFDDVSIQYDTYRDEAIHYWNCLYRYSLYYPVEWRNNAPTNMSDVAVFNGDGITVEVRAVSYRGDIESFVEAQKKKIPGQVVDDRDVMRNGARVVAYVFSDPYEVVVYWQESDKFMSLTISGPKADMYPDIIENIIATLSVNEYSDQCVN